MHGGGAVGGGHGGGFGGHGGGHGGFGAHGGSGGGVPFVPTGARATDPGGAPTATPPTVVTAWRLYVGSAVALALAGILSAFAAGRLARVPGLAGLANEPSGRGAGATAVVVGTAVGVVVVLALELLVAARLRRGRNWARIAVLVLGAWEVVALLLRSGSLGRQLAIGPLGAGSLVVEIVGIVAMLAAAVLLFRPETNAWFRARR